jgi:hypothetical protein
MLKKSSRRPLPHGRGSVIRCKNAGVFLSRARQRAVFARFQHRVSEGTARVADLWMPDCEFVCHTTWTKVTHDTYDQYHPTISGAAAVDRGGPCFPGEDEAGNSDDDVPGDEAVLGRIPESSLTRWPAHR